MLIFEYRKQRSLDERKEIMKYFVAINTEKTSKDFGKIISQNKIGTNKGLTLKNFIEAVKNQQCYSFKIEEI